MIARVLPSDEWTRLTAIEVTPFLPHLRQGRDEVLVVEDADGAIVSSAALIHTMNLHGWNICPEARGRADVIFAGMALVKRRVSAQGFRCLTTAVSAAYVAEICRSVKAVSLPLDHFVLSVEG